ncbi:hypothetical protein BGZ98_009978 [Dissophora globulifera]|nr:hypothetical protein BGZ98_009978 [Dissophora globulifera]
MSHQRRPISDPAPAATETGDERGSTPRPPPASSSPPSYVASTLESAHSPPNQPRHSLSAQLAPDYHDWVNDVSIPSSAQPPPSQASNRFLDAVTGMSKSQRGRARRENQPSFTGSAFNSSDSEAKDRDQGGDDDDDHDHNEHDNHDRDARSDPSSARNGSASASRLPLLSKSRVPVLDPSRPVYKLGAPIPAKSRSPKNRLAHEAEHSIGSATTEDRDQPSETSALLGHNGRPGVSQRNDDNRWTNEGSRRRTPRYNGPDQQSDHDGLDDDRDTIGESDFLARRPYRARSMSPNMESQRDDSGNRGRVVFRNYPGGSHGGRRSRNKTFHNFQRSSMANINLVKDKLLSRRSAFYDDAKEALVKENNGIRVWYHNYTTIDWIHDFVKERVRLRHLRSQGGIRGRLKNRADGLKGWVIVLLTGVITACLAAFIDVSSWWLGDLRMGYCTTSFWWSQYFCCWGSSGTEPCAEWVPWSKFLSNDNVNLNVSNDTFDWIIYCCFGVLFAGICAVMVTSDGTVSQQRSYGATKQRSRPNSTAISASTSRNSVASLLVASQPKKIAYFGAGSGIPEVKTILGGFVIRGFLGFRTLIIKLVASGLNMGKQGPLVHIACCVGNILCRIFDKYNRNDGKRREILSAAAASGVAVAFGAPIGGVLFSLEEVSYYFPSKTMWRTYFCALVSAVVLKGIYGALFSQFHMSYSRFRSKNWIGRHPVQEVLIVTLITCAIQWLNPWTRVNLLQLLTNLYSECTPDNNLNGMCAVAIDQIYPIFVLLAQVFVMKVFLNFITFGVKVPGGIFIPTMVAGAVFGRMVGLGVQWLIAKYPEHQMFQVCEGDSMDCIIPGLYAMIGAAACLSGVTRMTVSLVVIMFELTGAMTYALPIMMAVMIGKFVGDAFSPDAFFNKLIDLNEHPYLDNKKDYNTFGTAADIADRYLDIIDVNAINDVDSLRRKVEILTASGYSDGGLPIVDRGMLVGYIASNELGHALDLAEQKHKDCICVFRNRATSNVPATEIMTSLNDLGSQVAAQGREPELGLGLGLTMSPTIDDSRRFSSDTRQETPHTQLREDDEYDNDMYGHDRPVREASKDRLGLRSRADGRNLKSNNAASSRSVYEDSLLDGDSGLQYPDGSWRYAHNSGRVSSTGTTDLLRDPAQTMDFTPFTDQAPLTVSLFSSMDLVMELFIKLGIKYVCVVKAGEHYGMIHKKRLLTFLKENDENQKRYDRGGCF